MTAKCSKIKLNHVMTDVEPDVEPHGTPLASLQTTCSRTNELTAARDSKILNADNFVGGQKKTEHMCLS